MLKYKNLANVGDRIRAYDFRGNKEAFLEGVIVAKGAIKTPDGAYTLYEGFTIEIDKDGAEFGRVGDMGYIPFETSFDYDDRVELV